MAQKIDQMQVRKVAKLSRLELTDQEVQEFTSQLGAILEYVEKTDWKWSLKILAAGFVWPLSISYVIYELARDRWYN